MPWRQGMLRGAEKFMAFWHMDGGKKSRRRAIKRDN